MTVTTSEPDLSTLEISDSNKPPDPSSTQMSNVDSPKLGDFAAAFRLKSLALRTSDARPAFSPSQESQPAALGNFSKLYERLGVGKALSSLSLLQSPAAKAPVVSDIAQPPKTPHVSSKAVPITIPPPTVSFLDIPPPDINHLPALAFDSGIDSETGGSENDLRAQNLRSIVAITPPSSLEVEIVPTEGYHQRQTSKSKSKSKKLKSKDNVIRHQGPSNIIRFETVGRSEPIRHVLSYQFTKYGPVTQIHDHVATLEERYNTLMGKLVAAHACDSLLGRENPDLVANGIHVFIDMSNIIIGFQNALRAKYKLAESVRFTPLPQLNLFFLHKLLIRDRYSEMLNVGCSMHPDRDEPHFVQELQDIGYRVDIRHRRPEQLRSDTEDYVLSEPARTRYVEDMVDETLQIRIGESVMQHFDKPGTLVLATGDARPAKYSDGFLAYARRALKMGWNIEVVSWKASRSASWKRLMLDHSPELVGAMRFVELDHYLDELWAY